MKSRALANQPRRLLALLDAGGGPLFSCDLCERVGSDDVCCGWPADLIRARELRADLEEDERRELRLAN